MAGGVLRAALCSILTDHDHLDGVERSKAAKDDVSQFLKAVIEKDSCMDVFDVFASCLVRELEKCFFTCVSDAPFRSKHIKRERVWASFHHLRISKLKKMWGDLFLCDVGNGKTLPKLTPLVYQSISQKIYSDIINCHLESKLESGASRSCEALTVDEENIVRYIAGYVPFKLLRKYEKSKAAESVNIIECLSAMAVNGEESDAMEYTSKWIDLVNRGGLFEINDGTYVFFKEIELKVRRQLLLAFEHHDCLDSSQRDHIISAVAGDDSVQFHWTILSVDISDEGQAVHVLKEIIGLWVNIRGYSIAGAWLEKYRKTTAKKKALRKDLKKISQQKISQQ
jgi:hypothetical protein